MCQVIDLQLYQERRKLIKDVAIMVLRQKIEEAYRKGDIETGKQLINEYVDVI